MAAKHIQVARDNGVEAGLASFLTAPSSKLSPNYPKIVGNGRRSAASQVKAYESCFGATIAKTRPSKRVNAVIAERTISKKQELIEGLAEALGMDASAVEALMIGAGNEEHSVAVESDVVANDEFITRDVAWTLLGANPEFRSTPANRGEAASNGQMYRLNAEGLLSSDEVARLNTEAGA